MDDQSAVRAFPNTRHSTTDSQQWPKTTNILTKKVAEKNKKKAIFVLMRLCSCRRNRQECAGEGVEKEKEKQTIHVE